MLACDRLGPAGRDAAGVVDLRSAQAAGRSPASVRAWRLCGPTRSKTIWSASGRPTLVRRAVSLQQTRDARPPRARANGATIARLGLTAGDAVRASQQWAGIVGEATLELERDDALADGVVRIAAAQPGTAGLVCAFGAISIEKA